MSLDLLKLVVLFFCIGAVFFDLRSRKVPNYFVIIGFFTIAATFLSVYDSSWDQLRSHLLSLFIVFIVGFLMWQFRVLGAGDVKVLAIVAFSLTWQSGLEFFFYSLVWGSVLGVISLVLEKGRVVLINKFNLNSIMTIRSLSIADHRIPFTVAILFGVLSIWLLEAKEVHFL